MKVVVIVHTETEDEIRIISMREANKNEQLLFFRNL
ncbi:MAG: BrnT family toxin [Pseudanabaena sp.]